MRWEMWKGNEGRYGDYITLSRRDGCYYSTKGSKIGTEYSPLHCQSLVWQLEAGGLWIDPLSMACIRVLELDIALRGAPNPNIGLSESMQASKCETYAAFSPALVRNRKVDCLELETLLPHLVFGDDSYRRANRRSMRVKRRLLSISGTNQRYHKHLLLMTTGFGSCYDATCTWKKLQYLT